MKHGAAVVTAALLWALGCGAEDPDSFPVLFDESEAVRSVGGETPCVRMTIRRAECEAWLRPAFASHLDDVWNIDVTIWLSYEVRDPGRLARIVAEEGNEGVLRIEAVTAWGFVLASTVTPVERWPEPAIDEFSISRGLSGRTSGQFGAIDHVKISWD